MAREKKPVHKVLVIRNLSALTVTTTAMGIRAKGLTAAMAQWIFRSLRIGNLRLSHKLSANVRKISPPLTRKSSPCMQRE